MEQIYDFHTNSWQLARPRNHLRPRFRDGSEWFAYHYENLTTLPLDIASWESSLQHYSTISEPAPSTASYLATLRKRIPEAVKRLALLRELWPKIKPILRAESEKLFVLPRELRDMIYAHLYTNRFPNVELLYPRKEAPVHVLPRDPWMYLDASVVDPVIAAEAAQWLFFGNSFELIAQSGTKMKYNHLTHFLHTDHYGSGVKASETVLRRLTLTFPGRPIYHPTYHDFERNHPLIKITASTVKRRRDASLSLAGLLDLAHLEHVTLRLTNVRAYGWLYVEYREIAPVVKQLKSRGVRVDVMAVEENWWNRPVKAIDVSDLFDEPGKEDWGGFDEDPIEQLSESEKRGWVRCWLALHYGLELEFGLGVGGTGDFNQVVKRPKK